MHRPRPAAYREIIPEQIDDHQILRLAFCVAGKLPLELAILVGRLPSPDRAFHRPRDEATSLPADKQLGGRTQKAGVAEVQIRAVRNGLTPSHPGVERVGVRHRQVEIETQGPRVVDLVDVPLPDQGFDALDRCEILFSGYVEAGVAKVWGVRERRERRLGGRARHLVRLFIDAEPQKGTGLRMTRKPREGEPGFVRECARHEVPAVQGLIGLFECVGDLIPGVGSDHVDRRVKQHRWRDHTGAFVGGRLSPRPAAVSDGHLGGIEKDGPRAMKRIQQPPFGLPALLLVSELSTRATVVVSTDRVRQRAFRGGGGCRGPVWGHRV